MRDYCLSQYFGRRRDLRLNPKEKSNIIISNLLEKLIDVELKKWGLSRFYRTKHFEYDRNYTFVALCNWSYWDHINSS